MAKPGAMNHLLAALIVYSAAGLAHHAHNAHFLEQYPGMPAWLAPGGVYLAWLLATTVGVSGYLLLRRGHRVLGLAALFAYATYGVDALVHYLAAPPSAHSFGMNATIALEAGTAALLLVTLAWTAFSSRSAR